MNAFARLSCFLGLSSLTACAALVGVTDAQLDPQATGTGGANGPGMGPQGPGGAPGKGGAGGSSGAGSGSAGDGGTSGTGAAGGAGKAGDAGAAGAGAGGAEVGGAAGTGQSGTGQAGAGQAGAGQAGAGQAGAGQAGAGQAGAGQAGAGQAGDGAGGTAGGPTCTDGVQNQGETDLDCGGPMCPGTKCADGQGCLLPADCNSNECNASKCGSATSCTSPFASLLGWWHLDGTDELSLWTSSGSGPAYFDATGKTYGTASGQVNSGPAKQSDGAGFSGSSHIQLADNQLFKLTGSVTLEAWIVGNVASDPDGVVVGRSDGAGGGYELSVVQGKPRFRGAGKDLICSNALPAQTFAHLVGLFDASAKRLQIFVNGALECEEPDAAGSLTLVGPGPRIGADGAGGTRFAGTIDEVRIWGAALTPSQVQAQFAGTTCAVLDPVRWRSKGAPGKVGQQVSHPAYYVDTGFTGTAATVPVPMGNPALGGADFVSSPLDSQGLTPSYAFSLPKKVRLEKVVFNARGAMGTFTMTDELSDPGGTLMTGPFTPLGTTMWPAASTTAGPWPRQPGKSLSAASYFLRFRSTCAPPGQNCEWRLYNMNLIVSVD